MPLDLDPQEVLQHLYSLGYYNITKDQLKDFIKDLKKLIKYDLRKQERFYEIPQEKPVKLTKENSCYVSPRKDTSPCKHFASRHREDISPNHHCCHIQSDISDKYSEKATLAKEHFHLKPHSSVTSLSHSHICPKCHYTLDCNQPCSSKICAPQHDKDDTDSGSISEECVTSSGSPKLKRSHSKHKRQQANVKPCPSFIRPSSSKLKPPPKADPVALYHYYKTLWSQYTLPGENSHEDLRWRIRHKMSAPPVLTKTHNEPGKKPEWVPS